MNHEFQHLHRRQFLDTTGLASLSLALSTVGGHRLDGATPPRSSVPSGKKWYESAYRRAVIDMHIPDWDPMFLSEFDPEAYADMLVKARSQSIVCYCQSHVGLFNYPTKIGAQHRGWRGENMLARMIDCCHERGIAVQLYTSLIFDRWAGDHHPEWRMRSWDGKIQGEGGRQCVLCINSPYRNYVRSSSRRFARTLSSKAFAST